jgi:adenine phosphoribosyltransferase
MILLYHKTLSEMIEVIRMNESEYNFIRENIRSIPDYPKKGVIFRDITPLLKNRKAFSMCIEELAERVRGKHIDYIVGAEARGFIIGAALALRLKLGFIPVRKKGKLPYKKISKKYELEYGEEEIEIHEDAIEKGDSVLIVDDLLATGGTAEAVGDLVESLGGRIVGFAFVIELADLNGRERLGGHEIVTLLKY